VKYLLNLVFFAFLTLSTHGQVITSTPILPTENDSIVIVFDATQASNSSLVGYTGDLYAHTGVYTNLNPNQWQHVIGNWGNNAVQPQLTRIGTDLYELVIGYPRDFYSITNPSEHITQLNFVFRSANASLQTEDLFLPISEEGLNVVILEPTIEYFVTWVNMGDPVTIKAASTLADTLSLFLNDSLLVQTTEDTISHVLVSSQPISGYIIAKAVDSQQNVMEDSARYAVAPETQIAELPTGVAPGINYTSGTTATLVLFAPLKDFVYLAGDFNNWDVDLSYYMKRTPNDSTYWLEISGLTSGEEYAFQYVVDGEIAIGDPYTKKILDPWNDQFISDQTYPNLKEYPHGKTIGAVSILQTNQQPYIWQVTDFERPAKTDLVIYELLLRDFLAAHDYQTLIDTLDYLDNLGVNAIELMPVSEFEGNLSWGYNPSFHFALDKYYGTPEKFKEFIDECHSRGIAVIMDVVLNHAFSQSPFVGLYYDMANNRPSPENPWLNPVARHPFNVGFDFNHESPHTKYFVDRFNKFWMEEFNIDGFRYDLSKGFTQTNSGSNVGLWGQYDQSRVNILTHMANEIWSYDSTAYLILEHFADNSEEKVLADYGFMLWGNMNYNYNEATMGYVFGSNSDLTWGSYKARGWNDPHLVTYMESHDEERLMYKNITFGNSSGSYNTRDLSTGLNRMKLANAFFYTIPGPKMIWQFGELGYDFSINWPSGTPDDRLTPKPIRWDYFQDFDRNNLYKVNQELIKLKKNYDVFRTEDYSLDVTSRVKRIILRDDSINVAIIGNFDVVQQSTNLIFPSSGTWYDFFLNDSIVVTNPNVQFILEPGEFHLYSSIKLPSPSYNLLVDIKEDIQIPDEFRLEQNYPNPFNPSTKISYNLPVYSKVTLRVFNILGKEVATLVNKEQAAGKYEFDFRTNEFNLSSGIYFYQIKAGEFIQTNKMVLLK
jgi:1,4-alpha-glucan branching enzyme